MISPSMCTAAITGDTAKAAGFRPETGGFDKKTFSAMFIAPHQGDCGETGIIALFGRKFG